MAEYIVGAGMTSLGRHLDKSVKDLTAEAVTAALQDADCNRHDLEIAWFSNTRQGIFEGQHGIRGQCALRAFGIERIPIINTDNACASSSGGLHMAMAYIRSGLADVALVVGAEKMNYPDKRDLMFQAFLGSMDHELGEQQLRESIALSKDFPVPLEAMEKEGQHSVFMDSYAASARYHMMKYGTTQRQIAAVAAKNHWHSQWNAKAQYRMPMSIEEVLQDKPIVWPFTRSMCAPMSDGAAALIVCSENALARFGRARAVKILASAFGSGAEHDPADFESHAVRVVARKAYERAGVGPEDVSVAEVHDASAFAEIKQVENLGFAKPGEGGVLSESGETRLGGRIPVNTSGGLLSKGHPIAATGAIQLVELVTQLRGEAGERQVENAKIAVAENGGGFYGGEEAAAAVTILGRA